MSYVVLSEFYFTGVFTVNFLLRKVFLGNINEATSLAETDVNLDKWNCFGYISKEIFP